MSTREPLDIPEFTPVGEPSVVMGDLKLWFCGHFYLGTPVLVRSSLPIASLNLRIYGGNMWDIGRTHEFLIQGDTTDESYQVILYYADKTFKQGVKLIPDPIIKAKLGGQVVETGMASISAAKSTNLLEFEGEYTFQDPTECYPLLPELMVEGQVELSVRGVTKDRIEFAPTKSLDIKRLLDQATPGSQLIITQFNCMVSGNMVMFKASPTYATVVLMN